jgi:hypothetical protein
MLTMKSIWIAVAAVAVCALAIPAVLFRYTVTPLVAGELPAAFVLDRWTGETYFIAGRNKYHMSWNDNLPTSNTLHGMKLIDPPRN